MVGSCNNNGKPVIQDIVQHDNTIMMLTERCEQYRNIINILTSTNPIRDKVLNIHHTSLSSQKYKKRTKTIIINKCQNIKIKHSKNY